MQLDDCAAVADIHVRAWQKVYRGIMPQEFLDQLDPVKRAEGWRAGMEKNPHLVRLVSEEDGRVSGFAVGHENRTPKLVPEAPWELWAIYVDPEQWGKGAGTLLIQEFRRRLRGELCVWVARDNKVGHGFYQKTGGELLTASKNEEIAGVFIPHQVYLYS